MAAALRATLPSPSYHQGLGALASFNLLQSRHTLWSNKFAQSYKKMRCIRP